MVEWWIVVLCSVVFLFLGIGVMYGVMSSRLSSAKSDVAVNKQTLDELRRQAEEYKHIRKKIVF